MKKLRIVGEFSWPFDFPIGGFLDHMIIVFSKWCISSTVGFCFFVAGVAGVAGFDVCVVVGADFDFFGWAREC